MSIRVSCSCGKELQARDEDAGRRAQCPVCGGALVVPGVTPEERLAETPAVVARLVTCRECQGEFPTEDIYDDDGRLVCRHCYVSTASAPVRSSARRPARRALDDKLAIDNHLPLAVVALAATFFCCGLPLGLVPLIFALQVDGAIERGDYERARWLSGQASLWGNICLWLIGLYVVGAVGLFVFIFVLGLAG